MDIRAASHPKDAGPESPERAGQRTIDSTELPPDQTAGTSSAEAGTEARTIEYELEPGPAGPVASGAGTGTAGTLEFGEDSQLPGGGLLRAADRTLELDSEVPWDPGQPAGATLKSGELAEQLDRRQLTAVWGEEVEEARHGSTIKGHSAATAQNRSTLVINSRGMRRSAPAEPTQDGVDYDLWTLLGEGGMGLVYAARQASIDRTVAVKMLRPETASDERQRQKFLSEAVITGDLDHPNIVPIYELGRNHDGALFYSMKRVQGTPWDARIRDLSLAENLDILLRVSDAVAFAHSRGVIHRDLKPENVMLGEFGEVLVMDWGLAIPTEDFKKSKTVGSAGNMGGTPAYMAPEMASGPFQQITYASDIYLLGAILYEIVTGHPPHSGSDVMKCLAAALRNRITPTERQGELVDIALRAMATRPQDRFASVQEFQDAVREYLSHSESIVLAARAEDDLAAARHSGQYRDYAQAMFAFQEAATLWAGNDRARRGLTAARADYADCALRKGDYDLGHSLLDPQLPEHRELHARLERARIERDARQRRLKTAKRAVAGLLTLVFIVVTTALWAVNRERNEALRQKQVAVAQRVLAEKATQQAEKAKLEEAEARQDAVKAGHEAQYQAREAQYQTREAEYQAREAEYQAYIARIGLASAKIEENSFGTARHLLDACPAKLRDWEWGRLSYLCRQNCEVRQADNRLEAVAVSPDGSLLAAGGWEGLARIWQLGSEAPPLILAHAPSSCVYDLDFSPDGRLLATASSDGAGGWLRLWDSQSGQLVRVFSGHQDAVLSVRFSPDGQRLVSSSYDHTARLWDVASGSLLQTFVGHTWWVWSARFSADGRRIVTASQDGTARVWSVQTGQETGPPFGEDRPGGSQSPIYIAAFAPDGQLIASGGLDNRVWLWDPSRIEPFDQRAAGLDQGLAPPPFTELVGHKGAVHSIVFSSDGRRILSGSQDNVVNLWDAGTGRLIKSLRGHAGWVRGCRFMDGDQVAVSASHDATVRLWDIEGYEESRVLRAQVLDGHLDAVLAANFSRDGRLVVTASRDQTARTWRVADGGLEQRFREGHEYTASTAALFAEGKRLLTSAGDNTTRIWDVTTGSELAELRMVGTGVRGAAAVSRDGRWVVTGGELIRVAEGAPTLSTAQLWDARSGQLVHRLEEHNAEVTAVAISPDSRWLFSGDSKGRCVLWDRASGQKLQTFSDDSQINAAAFLPAGERLLTANQQGSVRQWRVPAAEEIVPLRLAHPDSVASMALSQDGTRVLTSCGDGLVRLWDADGARVVRVLEMNGGRVGFAEKLRWYMKEVGWDEQQLAKYSGVSRPQLEALLSAQADASAELVAQLAVALETRPENLRRIVVSVALSPDGGSGLTVAAEDRIVRHWNLLTGQEILHLGEDGRQGAFLDLGRWRQGPVWSAVFGPDGERVVTVGSDAARLWDLRETVSAEDRQLMIFSPHAAVAWADISPDGRFLLTASWDHSVRVWDAQAGRTLCRLGQSLEGDDVQHTGRVFSAVFSPDGRWILTTSGDRTAKLWSVGDWGLVHELHGHSKPVLHGTFSHDGQRIATSSADGTVRLWDRASGVLIATLSGHSAGVRQAAFSTDDRRLITGSGDNSAWVWDLEQQPPQPVHKLEGHTAAVTSVAFSPDPGSTRSLTGSEDYTAILWDAEGQEILSLKGHTQEVTSVDFSPDGQLALTASRDGTAILWLTESWQAGPAAEEELAGEPADLGPPGN